MRLPKELADEFQEDEKHQITMFTREDVEKIVRDCAEVCFDDAERAGYQESALRERNEALFLGNAILSHYGIQEERHE